MYCKLIILVLLICIIYVSYLISSNNIEGFQTVSAIACIGDRNTYASPYGNCASYAAGGNNGANKTWCLKDGGVILNEDGEEIPDPDAIQPWQVCSECSRHTDQQRCVDASGNDPTSTSVGNDPTSTSSGVTGNDPTSTSSGGNNGFTSNVCSKDTINNDKLNAIIENVKLDLFEKGSMSDDYKIQNIDLNNDYHKRSLHQYVSIVIYAHNTDPQLENDPIFKGSCHNSTLDDCIYALLDYDERTRSVKSNSYFYSNEFKSMEYLNSISEIPDVQFGNNNDPT